MAEVDLAGASLPLFITLGVSLIVLLLVLRIARSRFKKREDVEIGAKELSPDRAYNALITSEAIARELREKGLESTRAQDLLKDARQAHRQSQHREAEELSSEARNLLSELRKDEGQKEPISMLDKAEIPESKPVLGKEYPKNFLQAKFLLGVVKDSLKTRKDSSAETKRAKGLVKAAKKAFDEENYTEALSLALSCNRVFGGEEAALEDKEENLCPECKAPILPDNTFCGSCGARLVTSVKCSDCGTPLEDEDNFCRRCGTPAKPLPRTS